MFLLAAEIAAEMDKDDTQTNVENVASIKHRERNYMGMLEYRKEDEAALVKNLINGIKIFKEMRKLYCRLLDRFAIFQDCIHLNTLIIVQFASRDFMKS